MKEAQDIEEIETSDGQREDQQNRIEKAFLKIGDRDVHGLAVRPYTPARLVAAQAMGMHFGFIDDAGAERFRQTKLYPGAIRDIAIFMWLCVVATDEETDGAGIAPSAAGRKAVKWAESVGLLDTGSEKFWDAYKTFFDVMDEIAASRTKAEKKT